MGSINMKRSLVAVLACRNQGSRLYGKPLQNLSIDPPVTILEFIVENLLSLDCISEIVLAISEGSANLPYLEFALSRGLKAFVGHPEDVLSRLIKGIDLTEGTDLFRVTTESPFLYWQSVEHAWNKQISNNYDAIFMDDIIDGCGFEIISSAALHESWKKGDKNHRSEMCTLYLRENVHSFRISKLTPDPRLIRKDLRLTVDYPEDLVLCRAIYNELKQFAPLIPLNKIIDFLDSNPQLKSLVDPFVEEGLKDMYL